MINRLKQLFSTNKAFGNVVLIVQHSEVGETVSVIIN